MKIIFLCRRCYAECRARPLGDATLFKCSACGTAQPLRFSEKEIRQNRVDECVICRRTDFYVRDEPRKLLGLVYLLMGLLLAYWTYAVSLVAGVLGFDWYFRKYPKLTICYHCYAKYRDCRLNPLHKEYDLKIAERLEQEIRNDRTFQNFR